MTGAREPMNPRTSRIRRWAVAVWVASPVFVAFAVSPVPGWPLFLIAACFCFGMGIALWRLSDPAFAFSNPRQFEADVRDSPSTQREENE